VTSTVKFERIGSTLMILVRAIWEVLGCDVSRDNDTRTVIITKRDNAS